MIAVVKDLQAHEARYYDRLKPVDGIGQWYIDGIIESIAKYRGAFLVAEQNGNLIGYATLLTAVDSSEDQDEVLYTYSHVSELAVRAGHRGKGVGSALLAECERKARAAGQKWLRLSVLAANGDAREFYAAFGLREHLITLEKPLP